MKLVKLDCEKQQQDLLNSIKSQSLLSYQSFRPRDLFPHLKDLVILLIVVKSLETSIKGENISVLGNRENSTITDYLIHNL